METTVTRRTNKQTWTDGRTDVYENSDYLLLQLNLARF